VSLTLAADITAQSVELPASPAPGWYTLGDEIVVVRQETWGHTDAHGQITSSGRYVIRGLAGSTAVFHATGTALVPFYPDAPSSGGSGEVMDFIEPTTATPEAIVLGLIAKGYMADS
jgi:hypothetical protein